MTKIVEFLNDSFEFKVNFCAGCHNLIFFKDKRLKIRFIDFIFSLCEKKFKIVPYVISDFNLKPYLNLWDNIYDKFGIDLEFEPQKKLTLIKYCTIFNFKKVNVKFALLNNLDKLKSMFIVSLFSCSKVILFDNSYSKEVTDYVDFILDLIDKFNLFSDKVFIEIKKQVLP